MGKNKMKKLKRGSEDTKITTEENPEVEGMQIDKPKKRKTDIKGEATPQAGKNKKSKRTTRKKGKKANQKKEQDTKVTKPQNYEEFLMDLKQEPEILAIQEKRVSKRDNQCLFVSASTSLSDVSDDKISTLLPEILSIHRQRDLKNLYINFKNKESTKYGLKLLEHDNGLLGIQLESFVIVGKQPKIKHEDEPITVYQRVLYVSNLPNGTTEKEIRELFPKVAKIWPIRKNKATKQVMFNNFVFLRFATSEAAKDAFLNSSNFSIKGIPITVLYSKMEKKSRKSHSKKGGKQKQDKKKGKLSHKIKKKQALLKTKVKAAGHKKPKAIPKKLKQKGKTEIM